MPAPIKEFVDFCYEVSATRLSSDDAKSIVIEKLEDIASDAERMDNLLFNLDVHCLSFDVAYAVLNKAFDICGHSPMFKQYYQWCYDRFRRHYQWSEMAAFAG